MKFFILAFCICFAPLAAWAVGGLSFIKPLKTARTASQRAFYIFNIVFSPLILPLLLVVKLISVVIKLALFAIVLLIVPVIGVIIFITHILLPALGNIFNKFTGGLAQRIFSFVMDSPMVPIKQIDASMDTLASSAWKILIRNPIDMVIRWQETDWVLGWLGRRDGRVTYLLALARDPGLEIAKRRAAIAELGGIASKEPLRELACDRAVSPLVRLYAATTLWNYSYLGEARRAFWDMAQDANITDPLIRIQIAQGLSELGSAARSQAVNILTFIMADNLVPLDVRGEAAKAAAPLCDTLVEALKIDPILKQWAKSLSPQLRLQATTILGFLVQCHQNNPIGLVPTFLWDRRAVGLAVRLVTQQYSRLTLAIRVLGDLGEIGQLISLGNNRKFSYPSRSECARELERLGQGDEAALIWLDLAQQTNRLVVAPVQRVEAAAAAGQYSNQRETKEILQSIAQATCIDEPITCLEAAAALRNLGWYEEAISFAMLLDKNHRDKPEIAQTIAEAMRWREL